MFFTYVMMSERDNKLYIGFTNDLEKRVREHHKGVVASTANRRPLKLIYYEACLNEKDALKCVFQSKPATHSIASQPPIPVESGR